MQSDPNLNSVQLQLNLCHTFQHKNTIPSLDKFFASGVVWAVLGEKEILPIANSSHFAKMVSH